jgi:hypothetical protein
MQDIQIAHGLGFMASVEARLSTHQAYAQYFRSQARSTLVVRLGLSLGDKGHVTASLPHHSSLPSHLRILKTEN